MAATIPPGADLSKIPLAQNPNGSPPNFANAPSQSSTDLAVGLPFAILSTCFVFLRLITNFRHTRTLGMDDYLCLFAHVMMTVYFALAVALKDTARHIYDIPISFLNGTYCKREAAMSFVVGPALWSSKAAILALYIRIFSPTRWLRFASYIGLIAMFFPYWIQIPLTGAWCVPHHDQHWDFSLILRCGKLKIMAPVQGAVGIAADCFILVLPLPILRRLQMARSRKVGLSIVFLVGIFAIIASAVSLYYRIALWTGNDQFWYSANIWACVFVEGYVTIIVSCAPAASSFWVNYFIKSKTYSVLRSGLRLLLSTRSKVSKPTSLKSRENRVPRSEFRANVVQGKNSYIELEDSAHHGPHTDIYSHGPGSHEGIGVLTETTIDQSTNSARG